MNTIGKTNIKRATKKIDTVLGSFNFFKCLPNMYFAICGPLGLWPFRFVAFSVCGRFSLWPFLFVAVSVCGRFRLWPFQFVAVWVLAISVCGRYDQKPCPKPYQKTCPSERKLCGNYDKFFAWKMTALLHGFNPNQAQNKWCGISRHSDLKWKKWFPKKCGTLSIAFRSTSGKLAFPTSLPAVVPIAMSDYTDY